MGRPTKLTDEVQNTIVTMIANHHYHSTACLAAGIDEKQFYRWMERGRRARKGPFRQFRQSVLTAEATSEMVLVKDIAADKDWRAKLALLERRFRDRWRPPPRELSGPAGAPIPIEGPPPAVVVVYEGLPPENEPAEPIHDDAET